MTVELKKMLIGDRWIDGGGQPLISVDPSTGNINAHVSTAAGSDIDDAVAAARAAFASDSWSGLMPHQRADYLHRIARLIDERADQLARLVMRENGKTLSECLAQAKQAGGIFRYFAALCETLESEVTPPRGNYLSLTLYEPLGVVAAIVPWNSPITLAAEKLAPALAAGNAIILKPSELTSMISLELGRLCLDAGLPPGLVNILPGTAGTSSTLIRHPGIDMISFTGGTAAGLAVARAAAEKLVPVLLELGGKSPNIVLSNANVENAAYGVAAGIFGSMGQSCIAGSRLFVHKSVRDQVVEKIVAVARSLRLGPPDRKETQQGPLASFAHRDRVHGIVTQAAAAGARVITGGAIPKESHLASGAYYQPTVIDRLTNDAPICQTEIFGPVLCVLSFSDEDDLVRQANDSIYGLACGIWTREFSTAWRIARRIQAGNIWINTYRQNSVATPFGGYKQSGHGKERGRQGLRQYQQIKSIFVGTSETPLTLDR